MSDFHLPNSAQVGFTHLQVSNLEKSRRFYEDFLGFRPVWQRNGNLALSAGGKEPIHILLEVHPDAVPKPPRTSGLFHVAIRYPDRRSLGQALQRLLAMDWPVLGFSDHKVSEAIYLSDPDGLGLELYRDRPREIWPRRGTAIAMTTDPLDVRGLLAEAGSDGAWEGIPVETDIGHVHLQVPDLAEAGNFYRQVVGLDVTQEDYPGALFLSAGGYHHHVGLNSWAGRGAPEPPANAVGLRAFSFKLPNEKALGAVKAHLQASGREVVPVDGDQSGVMMHGPAGVAVQFRVEQ